MKPLKSFLPALFWALLITGIDLIPANPIKTHEQKWIIGPDKFIHFIQHFVLSGLIFWGFIFKTGESRFKLLFSVLLPVCLGVFIEIAQELWIPNRHFNPKDILANVLGSISLLLFTKTIINFQKKFLNK